MPLESRNGSAVSTITSPPLRSTPNPIGPHRPMAKPMTNVLRPLMPSIVKQGTGVSLETEMPMSASEEELTLASSIQLLWTLDKDRVANLKQSRHERASNRCELAKQLAEVKGILVGRGRDGQWLPLLKKICMPRSTAEGLIKRHLDGGAAKKYALDIPELTAESIPKLLAAIKLKLKPINTRELANLFVSELTLVLNNQIAQRIAKTPVAGEALLQGSQEVAITLKSEPIV